MLRKIFRFPIIFLTAISTVTIYAAPDSCTDATSSGTVECDFCSCCAPKQENARKKAETFYDEGFWFKADDNKLRVGGLVQADGRFFLAKHNVHSTFLIRRARIYLTGVLDNLWGYMVMGKWDRQLPDLHYAWIETLKPITARIRAGLFRQPFSLEALYSDTYLDFIERSLPIFNYLQLEDIGAMLFGKFLNDRIEYAISVCNGRARLLDNNHNKELFGRVVVAPFTIAILKKLYFGISGSTGKRKERPTIPDFVSGSGTTFWRWNLSSFVNDTRNRWGADVEWLYKSLAIRAEYIHVNWGDISNGFVTSRFDGGGAYAECSYILTGEDKVRNKPLIPFHNFNFMKCTWGAWEIVGRYELFTAAQNVINAGLATGASRVNGFTAGINCYINPNMVFRLNWQQYNFNNKVLVSKNFIDKESAMLARLQAEF